MWRWIWITLLVLLLIPAMQVAAVRFVDPPGTLPMWIEQVSASGEKAPLRYRWIDSFAPAHSASRLAHLCRGRPARSIPQGDCQIPEMFLEHLWISEDQRFFQHEGFDWKEMDLAMEKAERTGKPVRGASTITNQCARSI